MITAEQLIAIATAHGTDFQHIAGASSRTDGPARRRKRTKEEVRLGLDVSESVIGRQTRVYRRPTWSLAELGMAAGGSVVVGRTADGKEKRRARISRIPWLAARFSLAGDVEAYWELWFALLDEAQHAGRREGWAPRVRGEDGKPKFYFVELAQLVLDEQHHRWLFDAVPDLHAWYMGVAPVTWSQILADRYAVLTARFEKWLAIARSEIQREIMRSITEPASEAEPA